MLTFNREAASSWFVDLPEWEGDKADLQMVSGADELCDLLSKGENYVTAEVSDEPLEGKHVHKLTLVGKTGDIGADYLLLEHDGEAVNLPIWLCPVAEYVFGEYPKEIYIRQ